MANNYLIEPLTFVKPGICPKCRRGKIAIRSIEMNYYVLDQNANPYLLDNVEGCYLAHCTECDYESTEWMPTSKGFKYVPPWDRYLYENKEPLDFVNDNIKEATFDGNPFIEERL